MIEVCLVGDYEPSYLESLNNLGGSNCSSILFVFGVGLLAVLASYGNLSTIRITKLICQALFNHFNGIYCESL